MNSILVTGASSFLGYHVVKRLNAESIRPRVLEPRGADVTVLDRLDVERCAGHLHDAESMRAACAGAETLLHLSFKVGLAADARGLAEMRAINVDGTRRLLQAAAAGGVRRAVVAGSALAVGVNTAPAPLDESASWSSHAFNLPYAAIRRQAEIDALSQATARFTVVSVCPAFTFGPDDPTGAPANKLLKAVISRKLRFTLPVGFGCLDVRDFAAASCSRWLADDPGNATCSAARTSPPLSCWPRRQPLPECLRRASRHRCCSCAASWARLGSSAGCGGGRRRLRAMSCRSSDAMRGTTRPRRARNSAGPHGRCRRPCATRLSGCVTRQPGEAVT